jgi:DDE superfamily endonuclease
VRAVEEDASSPAPNGEYAAIARRNLEEAGVADRVDIIVGPALRSLRAIPAEPTFDYASAPRVFWIVDNGSDHRGQASIDRLEGRWPNLILVHLPVHASWLNQVEIYHSIIQRKLLDPTTSRAPPSSPARLMRSSTTTTRSLSPSPGTSPAKTSPSSSPDSTSPHVSSARPSRSPPDHQSRP